MPPIRDWDCKVSLDLPHLVPSSSFGDRMPGVCDQVRQHPPTLAPTLQNLLDTMDLVAEDRQVLVTAARPATPSATGSPLGDILSDAAEAAKYADPEKYTWARAHIAFFFAGLGRKSNYPETAAACRANALAYPDDARYWHREAAWWEAGAPDNEKPHLYG